jgi:hypothetical protein
VTSAPPESPINIAVEGAVDAAVMRKLCSARSLQPGTIYTTQGKVRLQQKLPAYRAAARLSPWLIVIDLDRDFDCAPAARQAWLAETPPWLCFSIAVRAIEAWLLADAASIARYLHVRAAHVPAQPEQVDDPKRALVALAARSPRQAVRADIQPRPGSGRSVGPGYVARLLEFIDADWNPEAARLRAPSLDRLLRCLESLRQ